MENTKIVFMGTPIFAAQILEHLLQKQYNIVGVISQPDKKIGRKQLVEPTEVKKIALNHNLPVIQPLKIKEDYSFLAKLEPDLIITAAYGQIVPKEVLKYPKLGCINIHGSLLPKYRGGAPIHYAILNGDEKTGVTIMEMVEEMDAGDMISQAEFIINKTDILTDVHDKMIEVAKDLIEKTLPLIIKGTQVKTKQNPELVTYSPTIKKEEELIQFQKSNEIKGLNLYNKIRAFNPFPGAYGKIHGTRFKFYQTKYQEFTKFEKNKENTQFLKTKKNNGEIIKLADDGIYIKHNEGVLIVQEFQIAGKKKITIQDFYHGNKYLKVGDQFE